MSIEAYYSARAPSYDLFYEVPEFADDLAELRSWLLDAARDLTILEIAAGTGYWTAAVATVARSVTATDTNPAMLTLARRRGLGPHVRFKRADAYELAEVGAGFDAGMAHLWWSHVRVGRQREWLAGWVGRLRAGSSVWLIDQSYVRGFSIPGSRISECGDRYEWRSLPDGSVHEILKNYPSDDDLERALGEFCDEVRITRLRYFWRLSARTRQTVGGL